MTARKIGPYEVVEELGRGGVGSVYRARTPSGREVAVKLLHRADGEAIARFERERRLLGEVTAREGFVPLLDAGSSPRGPHLVMPFVKGGTLRARLERGPLGVAEALALGRKLAAALRVAHERSIVHRDLKPENILFTEAGEPLIADLGLAKHFDRGAPGASQSVSLSRSGVLEGTAGYMPPEQLADPRTVGPAADVYALGAILYESLAGQPAFTGSNLLELVMKVAQGTLEPLRTLRPEVPHWLAAAIERALDKDPARRFADGGVFKAALDAEKQLSPARMGAVLLGAGLCAALIAGAGLALRAAPAAAPPRPAATLPTPPPNPATPPGPPPPALPELPANLRRGWLATLDDGTKVQVYLWKLPGDAGDLELVSVPAGEFVMGSDDADGWENEKPRHTHRIEKEYWIARHPVTWAQFRSFARASGVSVPAKPTWWDTIGADESGHPLINETWHEAKAFCDWAGLALPTEAEWERAARGTDGRRYPWGEAWEPGLRCNYADRSCPLDTFQVGELRGDEWIKGWGGWDREHSDGFPFTSPLGSFPRGVSPVGALDMAGNVWEWCADWIDDGVYARYAKGDREPPKTGIRKVARGAGWSGTERRCRSARRDAYAPDVRSFGLGIRPVLRSAD